MSKQASQARASVIAQKRATLRHHIDSLQKLMVDEYDHDEADARFVHLKPLFRAYEGLHEELTLLKLDRAGVQEMDSLSKDYFKLASKIRSSRRADRPNADATTAPGTPMGNSTFLEKQRQLKLPIAELPKFDGDLDKWLSFRNTFKVMVESRTDIDNVVKFMYLKNCLVGEAANKVAAYDLNSENYVNAWELLTDAYERKRILTSKHLDALFDIPKLESATHKDLSKMIDTVRQHVNMLELLDYCPKDYVIVRTLERALPVDIRLKWEESLSLDAIPTLKEFFTFIGGVVFRLHTMERDAASSNVSRGGKRTADRGSHGSKKIKTETGSRALVTATKRSCAQCQGDHRIYRCPVFEKLTVQQRWDSVKGKKLCRNCLGSHVGDCKSSHCKHCNRFHNSLLHSFRQNAPASAQPSAPGSLA